MATSSAMVSNAALDATLRGDADVVIVPVVGVAQVDHEAAGLLEQRLASHVGGQHRTIARRNEHPTRARQFIELAVNIPEHDPHVGHAERSIWPKRSSSDTSLLADADGTMRSNRA